MPSFLDSLIGRKPVVPQVPVVDLGAEQAKAVQSNLAVAPEAGKLATLSQDQINKMMEMAIPGFANLRGQVSSNISSLLRGEIPGDVGQAVKQQGAARSLTGGYGGTGAANNLVARDLGLTSLGLTQQGQSSAESWIRNMEQLYSPSQALFTGMFITPQQQYAATSHERDLQFQQQWLQEQINAMPSPAGAAFKEAVYAALSIYGGGGGGSHESPYSRPQNYGGGGAGGGPGAGGGIGWNAGNWQTTNVGSDWTPAMANDAGDTGGDLNLMGAFL